LFGFFKKIQKNKNNCILPKDGYLNIGLTQDLIKFKFNSNMLSENILTIRNKNSKYNPANIILEENIKNNNRVVIINDLFFNQHRNENYIKEIYILSKNINIKSLVTDKEFVNITLSEMIGIKNIINVLNTYNEEYTEILLEIINEHENIEDFFNNLNEIEFEEYTEEFNPDYLALLAIKLKSVIEFYKVYDFYIEINKNNKEKQDKDNNTKQEELKQNNNILEEYIKNNTSIMFNLYIEEDINIIKLLYSRLNEFIEQTKGKTEHKQKCTICFETYMYNKEYIRILNKSISEEYNISIIQNIEDITNYNEIFANYIFKKLIEHINEKNYKQLKVNKKDFNKLNTLTNKEFYILYDFDKLCLLNGENNEVD